MHGWSYQNASVLADSALFLGDWKDSIISMTIVSEPHLFHPYRVVFQIISRWNWAISDISSINIFCQATFAIKFEFNFPVFQISALSFAIRGAHIWGFWEDCHVGWELDLTESDTFSHIVWFSIGNSRITEFSVGVDGFSGYVWVHLSVPKELSFIRCAKLLETYLFWVLI